MTEDEAVPEEFVDDGDRSNSKVSGPEKGTDAPEVEIVDRQMAPKVSVKVERKQNLGDYNSITAQVFMSSGTMENMRGNVMNADGEIKEEIQKELSKIAEDLEKLATNRVLDTIKKHSEMPVDFDASQFEVNDGNDY